jgi:hypothetical protein
MDYRLINLDLNVALAAVHGIKCDLSRLYNQQIKGAQLYEIAKNLRAVAGFLDKLAEDIH